jgi:lysophospholipase L1-like esterase
VQSIRRPSGCAAKVAILLAMLVVLEFVSRPFLPELDIARKFASPFPIAHSDYLPFTLPASTELNGRFGHIITNPLGYRGPAPTSVDKPLNTQRLLIMGDSFTFGWAVEEQETIAGRLRAILSDRKPTVEVINAGYHDGLSPDAYYAYLRREGIALKPDAILIVLYTGNDITDIGDNVWVSTDESGAPTKLYSIRAYSDYQGRPMDPSLLPWSYQIPILSESRLFLALANGLMIVTSPSYVNLLKQGRLRQPLPPDEDWRRFELVTRATVSFCKSQNIPLVYVLIPEPPGSGPANDLYAPLIRKLISDEAKLPFIYTQSLLTPDDYMPTDGHLNAKGYEIVARAVFPLISPFLYSSTSSTINTR